MYMFIYNLDVCKDYSEEKNKFLCICKREWGLYLLLVFFDFENFQYVFRGSKKVGIDFFWVGIRWLILRVKFIVGGDIWKLVELGFILGFWNVDLFMFELSILFLKGNNGDMG